MRTADLIAGEADQPRLANRRFQGKEQAVKHFHDELRLD
jgi:hypothetical protein